MSRHKFPFAYNSRRERVAALTRVRASLKDLMGALEELGLDVMNAGFLERDEERSAQDRQDAFAIGAAARKLEEVVKMLPRLSKRRKRIYTIEGPGPIHQLLDISPGDLLTGKKAP